RAAVLGRRARGAGRPPPRNTRIEDVAVRAGVDETTGYRRWPTRAELGTDAARESSARPIPVPDTGTPEGGLRALARSVAAGHRPGARPAHHPQPRGRGLGIGGGGGADGRVPLRAPGPLTRAIVERAVARGEAAARRPPRGRRDAGGRAPRPAPHGAPLGPDVARGGGPHRPPRHRGGLSPVTRRPARARTGGRGSGRCAGAPRAAAGPAAQPPPTAPPRSSTGRWWGCARVRAGCPAGPGATTPRGGRARPTSPWWRRPPARRAGRRAPRRRPRAGPARSPAWRRPAPGIRPRRGRCRDRTR